MEAMEATEQELLTNNKLLTSKVLESHQTISKLNTSNIDLRAKFIEKEKEVSTIAILLFILDSFVVCCFFFSLHVCRLPF